MAFSSLLSWKPKYNSVAGPESDDDDDIEDATKKLEWKQRQSRLARFRTRAFSTLKSAFSPSAGLPWVIIFILSVAHAYAYITRPLDSVLVYTPVNHLIEYEEKVFTHQTDTRFIGPVGDPRIDAAWEDLYSAGLALELTEEEAGLIPNKTWPITQLPGRYYAALNVFHSLHCLDTIRKVLHPDIYDEAALRSLGHIPHCFDILRESIMCTGDTSVSVWQWIPGDKQAKQMTNTPHTCRNFDKIRDWAEERRMSVVFDDTTDHRANPLAGVWDEPADSLANQNQVSDI